MIDKKKVHIEYTVSKLKGYDKAFKPVVFINGKCQYTTARAMKTRKGGLTRAKKIAETIAKDNYMTAYNDIVITEKLYI